MRTDSVNLVLLLIATPPATAFVLTYGLLLPWFRSWTGWALFTSSTGLALLLNANLWFRLYMWPLLAREGWLRVVVYAGIAVGAWLMYGALTVTLLRARRELRAQR